MGHRVAKIIVLLNLSDRDDEDGRGDLRLAEELESRIQAIVSEPRYQDVVSLGAYLED